MLKAQEAVLTQSIDQQKVAAYPTAELEKFRDRYLAQIKSARTKLANSLIGGNGMQTAAFSACFQKGYAEWKTAVNANAGKAYPFDDRPIYDHVYQVLRGAFLMQGEMLSMEQDMEMQMAHQKLVEPRADNVPPIDFNPQEHALGFCLYADERKVSSHPEYSPRWMDVAAICQQNRDRIQNAYADMVKQVEFVGGAYSDEQVVLSLTAEQMGIEKGTDKNWLWLRNIPDRSATLNNAESGDIYGKWMDFHHRADSSPFWWNPPISKNLDAANYYLNRGCWNTVCKEQSFNEGVWHSNAQAWEDVYAYRLAIRKKTSLETSEDVISSMNGLEDSTTAACTRDANGQCEMREISPGVFEPIPGPRLPLFKGLERKPFWMNAKTFTYNGMSKGFQTYSYYETNRRHLFNMKCFLAGGINQGGRYRIIPYNEYSDWGGNILLSGKVCSSEEMAGMLLGARIDPNTVDASLQTCRTGDNSERGTCYAAVFGIRPSYYSTYPLGDSWGRQLPYASSVGKWLLNERTISYTFSFTSEWDSYYNDSFKPVADGNMYHMPVVDISQRKCKSRMAGGESRAATRVAGGVNIPSLCGEDLDKLISEIVPRPEFPPVPGNVVRNPEVTDIVNLNDPRQ